jgi:hypothetical protein
MEMELVLAEMGTTEDMGPELSKDMTNSSSHPTILIMHAQPVAIQKMQSYHPQTQRESLMRKIFVSGHRVQSPAQLSRVLWAVFSLDAFLMGLITYSPE